MSLQLQSKLSTRINGLTFILFFIFSTQLTLYSQTCNPAGICPNTNCYELDLSATGSGALMLERAGTCAGCTPFAGNFNCAEIILTVPPNTAAIDILPDGAASQDVAVGCSPNAADFSAIAEPVCLPPGSTSNVFNIIICQSGGGSNLAQFDFSAVPDITVPSPILTANCDGILTVNNATSVIWESVADPTLQYLTCDDANCMSPVVNYNGPAAPCGGFVFDYTANVTASSGCFDADLQVTSNVTVYPEYLVTVNVDCTSSPAVTLSAVITGDGAACTYTYDWSNGATTESIVIDPADNLQYCVTVSRPGLQANCAVSACANATIDLPIDCSAIINDNTLKCIEEVPDPDITLVSFSSSCGLMPLITSMDASNNGSGCMNNPLIITRTYIVDEDGDLSTTTDQQTCSQVFTIIDDIDPLLDNIPMSDIFSCDAIPAVGNPTATDNCMTAPIITFNETSQIGDCDVDGHIEIISRTWTATDACGNMDVRTQFLTIIDQLPPTFINPPANIIMPIECDVVPLPIDLTVTDNCDVNQVISPNTDIINPGACTNTYNIIRTWEVTDACGNYASHNQIIVVADNTNPELAGIPADVTVDCMSIPLEATPTATDNCDMDVAISFAEINTPGNCADNFVLTRTWTATDNCGNTDVQTQTITVEDNTPPTIDAAANNMTVQCDGTGNTTALGAWLANNGGATASDFCEGAIMWTNDFVALSDDCGATGASTVIFTATDVCGNANTTSAIFTIEDTVAPSIDTEASLMTVECDGLGNTTALNNWLNNNGGAVASDICSGSVTWSNDFVALSDDCGAIGTATVTFTATDDCGLASSTTATFIIEDTTAPSIDTEANPMTVECDGLGNTTALNDWLNNNGGAAASDICSGSVTWTNDFVALSDDCGATGSATVTFTATDDCGLTSNTTAIFTIQDMTVPNITIPATNLSVECDGSGNNTELTDWLNANGNAIASDVCSEPIQWTNNFGGLNGGCGATGDATVTFTATDDCNNSSVTTAVFTITGNAPPTIDTDAMNMTVQCDGQGNTTALNAWLANNAGAVSNDVCSGAVNWTNDFGGLSDDCGATGSATVTFTATDACLNTVQTTATFTIQDITVPSIDTEAVNETVQCDGTGNAAALTAWLNNNGGAAASDICSGIAWTNDFGGLSDDCGATGSATVTFTATDDCGLSSSTMAIFTIEDMTVPSIDTEAVNETVQCDGVGNAAALTTWLNNNGGAAASDICSGIVWTNDFTVLSDDCGATGSATVTFTATDDCGLSSSTMAIFTIEDMTVPSIDTEAVNETVQCDGVGNAAALTTWLNNNGGAAASDICSGIVWTNDFTVLSDDCGATGAATVTFTATDDCGLASSTTAIFTIQDMTVPSIDTEATNLSVECDGSGNNTELTDWLNANGNAIASDICSGPVIWTNDFGGLTGGCGATGNSTVTFTATDDCGLSSSTTATFTITGNAPPTIDTQASDMTVQCDGAGNTAGLTAWLNGNGGAVANDVCSGAVNWTNDFGGLSDDCGATGSATVTFTATDACLNTVQTTATFTIEDITVPSIDTEAVDETVQCDGAGNTADLTAWLNNNGGAAASDICSGIVWTNDFAALSDDCGATGAATVTFTATDDCGLSSSTTAIFTIQDMTNPTIDTEAVDETVQCDGAGNAVALTAWLNNNGGAAASDICSGIVWTNDFAALSDDCGATGAATVTFTATDDCGLSASTMAIFTIEDITPPNIITEATSPTVECNGTGNTVQFDAWLLANGGAGATDACSAVVWTNDFIDFPVACGAAGAVTVVFTATDDCGLSSTTMGTYTIDDSIDPALITPSNNDYMGCSIADITPDLPFSAVEANVPDIGAIGGAATDVCGTVTVTYIDTQAGGCPDPITITRIYTVTDDCGNSTTGQQTITVVDSEDPTIMCPPARTYIGCSTSDIGAPDLPFSAVAAPVTNMTVLGGSVNDDCAVASLTYIDTQAGGCPADLVITRIYTVTDACGNTASCTQLITIVDTTNPTITAAGMPVTFEGCSVADIGGIEFPFSTNSTPVPAGATHVLASDNCNVASFTYSDVETGGCPSDITITRTYVATDACGNTDQAVQIITIEDTTPPAITACPAPILYEGCNNTDIGADNLPFSAIEVEVTDFAAIGGAASDACSLTITYMDTEAGGCPDPITITRVYTASDDCGNTTQCTQTITINDTTDPVITTCPPNRTYEGCSSTDIGGVDLPISLVEAPVADIAALGGDFSDNCNIASITYIDIETGACPDPITITRTYTSTDDCGNSTQCVQVIMIEDTTQPIMLCQDITITADPNTGMASIVAGDIDGGSFDACSAIGIVASQTIFSCDNLGPNNVELTATDACGNSNSCTAVVFLDSSIPKPATRNAFHCIGKDVSANEGLEAICSACDGGGVSTVEWYDSEYGGNLVHTGAFFHPVYDTNANFQGVPGDEEGCYIFYAACRCDNVACPSLREKASFQVVNCELDCADGCTYFLVLEDAGCDGWDAASIDVSINEAWPATNYKLTPQQCDGRGNYQVIPLDINDGGTIDLAYWNGALEHEHAYTLLNYAKDTIFASGYDLDGENTVAPQTGALDFKVNCPSCCTDELEDFTVRITMGDFAEEYSWEIYDGTEDTQGTQVMGVTANTYVGLAPGTQITYDVQLEKCANYTFVAFDGFNDSWNGGTWEIITSNLSYGTEITNTNDPLYGNSLVMTGPNNPAFIDEDRVTFTIPCQTCYDAPLAVSGTGGTCNWTGDLPVNEPFVCYPNCNHALPNGCIGEELIALVDGDPFQAVSIATGPFTYVNGVGIANVSGIPVGDHKLVQVTTYCDGIISKCTTNLNVTLETNPSLVCNDLLHISLATPEWNDDDNNTGNPYQDDLGECVIEVTPDMVLEMPNFCPNDYKVTILDADGQPLVVYDVNDLPLDEAGFSIPEGNQSSTPANNLVSAAQAGQTLTYVVEHLYSDNACWGEIRVEDKDAPTITCVDYDVACTHPNALDELYTHTDVYAPTMELPANIAGGDIGTVSNTFIPVNMPCGALGEIIQNIEVAVDLTHTDVTDLSVVLHAPTATGLAPMTLGVFTEVGSSNVWTPSPASAPALGALVGMPCSVTESTSPEDFVTENSGANVPANAGGTWYIQVIDNNATFAPQPPFGGGEVTTASITLTCGFPFPYAAYDCTLQSVTLLSEVVDETLCNQSDWNGALITRIWQAEDAFGHTSTCTQTVGLKAPAFDNIIWPADMVLNCDGDTDPITSTGVLAYDCFPMTEDENSHGLCDISYTYEDQIFETCGNGYKIYRHWTAINWCSGNTKEYTQIIKLEDQTGPVINVADIVSNTAVYDCTASLSFNEAITDACSAVTAIEVRYTLGGGAYGTEELVIVDVMNGGTIDNLPVGVTEVMVIATDECLNITEELISVRIQDNTAPVAVCNDNLNISLGSDGQAWIYAADIDEGSWDNCGIASLEVRRADGCLGTSTWADSAPVDCCDVDQLVTIELRVTDNAGNTNVCWQTVLIEDALAPTVTCPNNVTVDCNDPLLHDLAGLSVFGDATYEDNCSATATLTETDNRDQCKAGTISRRWVVSDGSSKSQDANCTQTITVNHVSDFIVQFPSDVTVSTCPDDLGLTGEPTLSNDDCELVAINHDDLILTIVDDACYKIERTWTLVNWCVYDEGNPANTDLGIPQPLPRTYQDDDGYFTYTQIIKVLDSEAPVITCPGNQVFCDLTDDCDGEAVLTVDVEDGCSPSDALEYTYKIDVDNDGDFDVVDSGNDATGIYPYGTHLIKWIVEDGCGNTSSCSYLFTIEDCKNPTPVCLNGISIENMQTGCVEVWASDLLEYAFDNCSSDGYVESTTKIRRVGYAGAPQSALELCCDDIGVIGVEIWVEDEAGNSDYCTTYIIVQDNLNNCPQDESKVMIAGHVETYEGEMVEDVMMDVNTGASFLPTSVDGTYAFPNLSMNNSYTVTPEKDHNPTNGVSTFDLVLMSQHILGINEFTSPYQLIAADVNGDGNVSTFDVVQNRQLILYLIEDFPNNTSWRFVDKDYVFPNPLNPWLEAFPEMINFATLDQDEMAADFVGIKIGDVNGDAVVNSLLGAEDRNINGTLQLRLDDARIEKDDRVVLPVYADNFIEINGFQYSLNFDVQSLGYTGIESGAIQINDANIGTRFVNEGILTTSWNVADAMTISKETILFTLIFDAKANTTVRHGIDISSRYTKAEAYSTTDLLELAITFENEDGTIVSNNRFELLQNQPNPFNGATTIGFILPQASTATVKVFDVSGQLLKVIEGDFNEGYNQISLSSKDLSAKGLLYYELTTSTDSATKKMLIIE